MTRDGGEAIDYLDLQQNHLAKAVHLIRRNARYLYDDTADLNGLEVIVLPLAVSYDEAWEKRLADWVQQGGQLVVLPLQGAKNEWNAYREEYRSPVMRQLTGTSIRRRIPVRNGHHTTATLSSDMGSEIVKPYLMLEELVVDDETDVVAQFTAEPLDDAPFFGQPHR